jgi:hypothetical protein
MTRKIKITIEFKTFLTAVQVKSESMYREVTMATQGTVEGLISGTALSGRKLIDGRIYVRSDSFQRQHLAGLSCKREL